MLILISYQAQQSIQQALEWADELQEQLQQRRDTLQEAAPTVPYQRQPAPSVSPTRGKNGGGGLFTLRAQTPEQVVAARTHWLQKRRRRKGAAAARADALGLEVLPEPDAGHEGGQGEEGRTTAVPAGVDSSDADDSDTDDEYEAQLNDAVTQISEELFGIRTLLSDVRMKKTYLDSSYGLLEGCASDNHPLVLLEEEQQLQARLKQLQTRLSSLFSATERPRSQGHTHTGAGSMRWGKNHVPNGDRCHDIIAEEAANVGDAVALEVGDEETECWEGSGTTHRQREVLAGEERERWSQSTQLRAELEDTGVALKGLMEAWNVAVADEECAWISRSGEQGAEEGGGGMDVDVRDSERLRAEIDALQVRSLSL